jgi:Holliday junction resolvase RusA-like endonuclease
MQIEIFGNPIAQQRAKISTAGRFPRMYSTQANKLNSMRHALALDLLFRQIDLDPYFRLPIAATIYFDMPIPKSLSKSYKNAKLWHPWHSVKPDIDNLQKWVFDLCKGIAFNDDAQICSVHCLKRYSLLPRTIINLQIIQEVKMSDDHEKVFKTFSPSDIEAMSADAERIFMSIPAYKISDTGLYESQMNAAAQMLIDFANEWSDKLKKIKGK